MDEENSRPNIQIRQINKESWDNTNLENAENSPNSKQENEIGKTANDRKRLKFSKFLARSSILDNLKLIRSEIQKPPQERENLTQSLFSYRKKREDQSMKSIIDFENHQKAINLEDSQYDDLDHLSEKEPNNIPTKSSMNEGNQIVNCTDTERSLNKTNNISKLGKPSEIKRLVQIRHRSRIRQALNISTVVILPEDPIKAIWSTLILLLLLYASLVTPYRVAFVEKDTMIWIIIDYIVDFFFLIDLILNMFFFAYYDKDEQLIFSRKQIVKKYLKSWFIVDFIAILPLNLIILGKNYNSLSRLARLPRLYKLLKITKIIKAYRVCRERSNWMEYAPTVSVPVERLIAFVIIIVVLIHVSACLWMLIAVLEGLEPDTWVIRYSFQDSSNFERYTACVHFIITTITTVGYGDISPYTLWERWFGIMAMVVGVMSYSYMISSLSSFFTSNDIKQTKKNHALESLRRIDLSTNLDTGLFLRIKKAIIKKFKEVEYIKNRDALLHLLPRKLKGDLNSAMHESLVRKIGIFREENPVFVDYLARLLKPKKYSADEYICKEGEGINAIYFLIKGKVEYVLPKFNDAPYLTLSKGARFGDLEIVYSFETGKRSIEGNRIFTAKAKEDCEILSLSKTDLLLLYKKYEKQIISIFEGADLRLKHTLEHKTKIENGLRHRYSSMNRFVRRISVSSVHSNIKTGYTIRHSHSDQVEEDDSDYEDEQTDLYSDLSVLSALSDGSPRSPRSPKSPTNRDRSQGIGIYENSQSSPKRRPLTKVSRKNFNLLREEKLTHFKNQNNKFRKSRRKLVRIQRCRGLLSNSGEKYNRQEGVKEKRGSEASSVTQDVITGWDDNFTKQQLKELGNNEPSLISERDEKYEVSSLNSNIDENIDIKKLSQTFTNKQPQ